MEIENSLVELKNAVRALSANESETDSDSDSVNGQENDEIKEEPLIQENPQQQAAQQQERENGQENRRESEEITVGDHKVAREPEMLEFSSSCVNWSERELLEEIIVLTHTFLVVADMEVEIVEDTTKEAITETATKLKEGGVMHPHLCWKII